jgi:head-tail adaptor
MPLMRNTAWPHIEPGKKRHKIEIQAQSQTTQDTYGEPLANWPAVLDCWAAIETINMREQFENGFVSQVVHRISLDWPGKNVTVKAGMRVVVHPWAGATASVYLIQTVENVEQRNLVMRLTCLELDQAKVGATS